jgi:hypothetical protein
MQPPSSGSKNKPSKKAGGKQSFHAGFLLGTPRGISKTPQTFSGKNSAISGMLFPLSSSLVNNLRKAENLKGRDHFLDLDVNGKIVLKCFCANGNKLRIS